MTREEAKEFLPIIQAFAENKIIECRRKDDKDGEWKTTSCPNFCAAEWDYRIKPSPKYRPFKDAEECWQEMQKHQPFGWIYTDENKAYRNILSVDFAKMPLVLIPDQGSFTLNDMFECYTFADGSIFGVKEEEV